MLMIVKQLRQKKEYLHWYAIALSYKADDLHALKRYDEAFGFYFLAREAILKTGDACQLTNSTTCLGKIGYKRKRYNEAARFFKEAYIQRSESIAYPIALLKMYPGRLPNWRN